MTPFWGLLRILATMKRTKLSLHQWHQRSLGFVTLLIAGLLTPASSFAASNSLAYVRASSQFEREKSAAKYHPIHVVDDNPETMWCEGSDDLGEDEELRIFFKRPQKIDRIVIGPSAQSGRIISMVRVSDGMNSVDISLNDSRYVEQSLQPPMRGERFTITIVEVGGPNTGSALKNDVACLADVMLFYKKKPFGSNLAATKLRYNKYRDKVLGRWAGGPLGAPEKFLTFAIDGTWRWTYEPMLGGSSKKLNGEYRFRGNRLLMRKGETGRWADVRFHHNFVKVDPDSDMIEGDYEVISFNAAVNGALAGDYNNAVF